ncbi:TraM recognition domain-containing protein [Chryseobacterium sp. A301]
MQEQIHQLKIYGFFQKMVYGLVVMETLCVVYLDTKIPIFSDVLLGLSYLYIFFPPFYAKIWTLILICIVAVGTKARKKSDLKIWKAIVRPIFLGLFFMAASVFILLSFQGKKGPELFYGFYLMHAFYALFSLLGALFVQVGADSISKFVQGKLGKDRFNTEQESFKQNEELIGNATSINLPYKYRHGSKMRRGWVNLDPFRGTLVIGTPGSGKSFGVIAPAIRQMVSKEFSLCLYDFKFPDLAQIAYYHHLQQKKQNPGYTHSFHVVNLNEVEKSRRINPLQKKYVPNLAMAQEMAESMVFSLQKGGSANSGGADQFFTQSAVNFLSACIYFLASQKQGKYSSLPHLLSFLNKSYEEIFSVLFTEPELHSMLAPFKSAYDNRAFDQLEGQVGTLRVLLSRLSTKESYWVFSGEEVNLKITDQNDPSVLVLASSPETEGINSALYASVLNRVLRVINQKGNLPAGIIADEFPTIYIHKIDSVVATARSSKIAVMLGLQELPQLKQLYKREVADTICSVMGNILCGSVRDRHTLEWLERLFGKIKQKSYSESYSSQGTSFSSSEKMDTMIPAGKIASLRTGEMVGMIASSFYSSEGEYRSSAMSGKIELLESDSLYLAESEVQMPIYYDFKDEKGTCQKEKVLLQNFSRILRETDELVNDILRLGVANSTIKGGSSSTTKTTSSSSAAAAASTASLN